MVAPHSLSPLRMAARSLAVGCAALALACSRPDAAAPQAGAAPLPKGAVWSGVYEGPHFLFMQLGVKGREAQGSWRAYGGVEGQLNGKVDGNLLRYRWTEFKDAGKSESSWSGNGYFIYTTPAPGQVELRGEWGLGTTKPSRPMWAVRKNGATAADLQLDEEIERDDTGGTTCISGCDSED